MRKTSAAAAKKRPDNTGSVSMRQRADGRWEARLTIPGGKRRSFYGATWEEAEAKMIAARSELEKGRLAEPGRATVRTLGEEFFRLNPLSLRETTVRSRKSYFKCWIEPLIGDVPLRKLTAQHVHTVRTAQRDAGKKAGTINGTLATMSNIFAYGVSANLLQQNPAAGLDWDPAPDPRDLPIENAEQIELLLTACRASNYRTALMLGIGLGLRSGEARGLRWRDVDFDNRIVRIRNGVAFRDGESYFQPLKTRSSRRDLPMPDFIFDELKLARKVQAEKRLRLGPLWKDHDLVCSNFGTILSHATLAKEMLRIRNKTGIDELVFHHLRHLCATMLMINNVPPRIAQAILGHATSQTTLRIYQHVNSASLREAAEVLNAVFARPDFEATSG